MNAAPSGWISDSAQLAKLMGKIDCRGGNTQIGKVLSEARREAVASAVRAVVFVGDAMEEAVDDLCAKAGELGLLKVPVFMFQEGHDAVAEQAFREIARLTGGAWCRFDPGAAAQLRELLARRRGLCRRRTRGAAAAVEDRQRRRQTARPDEVIAGSGFPEGERQRHAFCRRSHYIEFMPTLIAGVVAVILLYLAAADVSCGQSGRARARHQDRRRRRGARGRGLYRHQGRTRGRHPARHLRRGAVGLVAVRGVGLRQYRRDVRQLPNARRDRPRGSARSFST